MIICNLLLHPAPSALSDTFMWEDMANYVEQREQFVDNWASK